MEITLLILAIVCLIGGFAGCIIPILPGLPLSYLGMLLAHWSGYASFSTLALVVWGIIMVVISIIDFLLTPWMTRRFGGHKAGSWGALIGLAVGVFLPWPFGPMFGPFVGALIGEIVYAHKDTSSATNAALGSFLSFFIGTGIKLLVCGGMVAAVIYAAF